MDFQYEDTYAPYERIATSSGTGQGNAGLLGLTGAAPEQVPPDGGQGLLARDGGQGLLARDGGQGLLAGAVTGFLGAAVALGAANLTAAFVRPQASPIVAVGGALKHLAVEKFGENDKNMLLLGVYVTIALLAMAIGVIAWRQDVMGVLGIGLFGLVGAFIAVTRPESHATDAIPSIVGGIAAMAALAGLIRAGTRWIGYETPGYESPSYESRSYESAGYGTPPYGTPPYRTPAYETVNYGTPAYETATYGTPGYETVNYGSPAYETPSYETPSYETPAYETANYGRPGYEFPARETSAYESATYRTPGWTS